jgi:SAM-dependent methyltransferase
MTDGWSASAAAWIMEQGEHGDFARRHILDAPMLARIGRRRVQAAVDVGCGEGRFCRLLRDRGIPVVGIDPTEALIATARERDPGGDYRVGRAEALAFADGTFDLVVSYLTLIDIGDLDAAIAEMTRVLRPAGTILIANLASHFTASIGQGWTIDEGGTPRFCIDHYLEHRTTWAAWRGIRVRNWHRPLSAYMSALIEKGLILRHFDEPAPTGGPQEKLDRYRRVPGFVVMEWQKPAGTA